MKTIKTTKTRLAAAFISALSTTTIAPLGLVLVLTSPTVGQNIGTSAAPAAAVAPDSDAQDRGWPRRFEAQGNQVVVYAPQVDEWPHFDRITFRAAISVAPTGSDELTFGIIRVSASTKVAFDERLVVLTDRKVEEITFSDVESDEADRLKGIVMSALPQQQPQTVSLDRLVAGMDPAKVDVRKVNVNTDPPKIFTSSKPAILVIFMGKARFKPVPDSDLLFAINTNWDIFLDPNAQKYYLLNGKSWLATGDLDKGPWTAATSLPPSLSKLPANENWNDVRAAVPGVPTNTVPVVYVSNVPAELIVTQGDPELQPVPGTRLMLVANSENTLFYSTAEQQYYLLAAGRWFKAGAVAGPWATTSASLPADFKKIPADSEFSDVLASVPGTVAANEAVVMASIPQKATINRNEVTLNVTYDGPPKFQPIESTTVQYAYNTPFSVFLVDGKYYCCNNAVWFEAPTPTGTWTVCVSVPKAIYTIPPTSPEYNVTYVNVYESTPTTVVTGYTAGYSGATVAATGVVMFGMGILAGAALNDDCCWSYHYPPCYFSYGCGAAWHGAYGGYVCGNSCYGPYGGAGHAAAYNPSTGVYSRAGYAYGPNGAAGYRTAYNPSTGVAAGRAGGVTPYGSWGSSCVTNGDQWVKASHQTTARGTTGSVQTSGGAEAATAQGRYGNGATVAKSQSGDYYAAHDGNVYKNTGSGWESANRNSSGQASSHNSEELQQQASARSRGEYNANRTSEYQRSGGGGSYGGGGGGRRR